MKKKTQYTNEKIGRVEVVKDFLPKPEGLVLKEVNFKTTINLKLQFLFMQNCPNISPLWESLQAALKELQYNQPIDKLDINSLSEKQDKRAGFGSPTILVDGKDLFDSPFPETYNPSCRYYPNGIPNTNTIVSKLKSVIV